MWLYIPNAVVFYLKLQLTRFYFSFYLLFLFFDKAKSKSQVFESFSAASLNSDHVLTELGEIKLASSRDSIKSISRHKHENSEIFTIFYAIIKVTSIEKSFNWYKKTFRSYKSIWFLILIKYYIIIFLFLFL